MMRWSFIIAVCFVGCRPPAVELSRTSISGRAMLVAPIAGAHVRVTMLDGAAPEIVAETVTDEEGRFDVELVNGEGTLLVEVLGDRGGSTREPVSQKPLELSYTDRFANLMTGVRLGQSVAGIVISPWSTLIAARAQWEMERNGAQPASAIATSAGLFLEHFGGIAFLGSEPMDPSAGPTNGLPSAAVHGFVTSALGVMAADLSRLLRLSEGNLINAISLTQWLADDLRADGRFDGQGQKGKLLIVDDHGVDLELTRAHLGAALGTFTTSARNLSGVALSDLTALINAITSDGSILYGAPSSVAVSDGDGPRIVVTSPLGQTTLRNEVIITGNIKSPVGVAGAEIFLDDVQVSSGDRTAIGSIEFSGSFPLTDGYHVLRVTARDSNGKPSSVTVPFSSDATPPTIKLSFCTAFDDRARSQTPAYSKYLDAVAWYAPSIPDVGCTFETLTKPDSPYTFHAYSELAKAAGTSSQLGFVPEESGPVTTAQSSLAFEASLWKGTTQIGETAKISANAGETSRRLALSSVYFGSALRDVSVDDTLELRLVAADAQGNEGALSLFIKLDFMPSPMKVEEITAMSSPAERVDSYTFAAGNLSTLLDPAAPLPADMLVVRRYAVTNLSDRPIVMKLPLAPGGKVTAAYDEWVGFVAGEEAGVGTDTALVTALTEAELGPVEVPSHWGECVNNVAKEQFTAADLPQSLTITSVAGGTVSCIGADALLTTTPVESTDSAWVLRVHTEDGALRFATSGGDYVINAGETLAVSVGFQRPSFSARQPLSCVMGYKAWAYNSSFAPRQYTDIFVSNGASPLQRALPFGLALGARTLMQYQPLEHYGWTYADSGWVDCAGYSCNQPGCRTATDQFLLRLQGVQTSASWFVRPHWVRVGYRQWAELALSRFRQPHRLSIEGSAGLSSSSRLKTNKSSFDYTFNLPEEQFSVQHSTTFTRDLLPQASRVLYTKGTLP